MKKRLYKLGLADINCPLAFERGEIEYFIDDVNAIEQFAKQSPRIGW